MKKGPDQNVLSTSDWQSLVRSSENDDVKRVAFMIDIAELFNGLNQVQKLRAEQFQIESYRFYPILKSFCT